MAYEIVTDDLHRYLVDRLSARVSWLFFESLTVLLTVYLTFLLSPRRDVDEISGKINVQENKRPTEEK